MVPQHGWWFIRENPIKMDDLGVPLFLETPIYMYIPYMGAYGLVGGFFFSGPCMYPSQVGRFFFDMAVAVYP